MAELIVSILVLLVAARALGEVFERFRQSAMIGEILAGVLLGPAVLRFITDPADLEELAVVSDLGVFMLVCLAGLEMSLEGVSRALKGGGLAVGAAGFAVPFLAGYVAGLLLAMPEGTALVLGLCLAVTALPTSVRILLDLGLTDHRVGQMIVSCAIINDVLCLTLLGIIINLRAAPDPSLAATAQVAGLTLLKTSLLVSIVLTFSQLLRVKKGVTAETPRVLRRLLASFRGRETLFAFSMLFVLAFASASELLGLHFVVGAFFGGLLLSVRILGEHNYKQVERTTSALTFGFLAPIFFGYIGLLFTPDAIAVNPALAAVILVVAVAGKLAGGYIGGRLIGYGALEAQALGLGLNARGMIEIVVASLAYSIGLIGADLFTILVLMTMVTVMMTPPMLKWSVARADRAARQGRLEEEDGRAAAEPAPAPLPAAPAAAARPGTGVARVVIVGGGRVATEIARVVGPCTMLERDEEQARIAVSFLSEVEMFVGEATNEADLRRLGLKDAVVLAVTDSDEANEFVVRTARAAGARRVIARTDKVVEVDRLRSLGADGVVNWAHETANAVLLELYPPDQSMIEVLLQRGAPALGQPLSSFELPKGTVVRSVSRRGRVHVPTPDLVLEARDTVILSGPPSALETARERLAGPRASGHPLHVYALQPHDGAALRTLVRQTAPLAARSGGGLVVAVPWEGKNGPYAPEVRQALEQEGISATVLRGYSLGAGDLLEAIRSVRSPSVELDGFLDVHGANPGDHESWLIALPSELVGRANGLMRPRRLVALPAVLGVPVLVARGGRPPRTVVAIIDGAEGADAAGTLACEVARHAGARLSLLVCRFEGEAEPLEQAAFIEAYARSIGLGAIEVVHEEDANAAVVERRLRGKADLVVCPCVPRLLRGRDLARMVAGGEASVLLV